MASSRFNDPIFIQWRAGTEEDPYVSKVEPYKIVENEIVLKELPDEFTHVAVDGYIEIKTGVPLSGEFIVDYQSGAVIFNPSEEAKTVTARYKGRGQIKYPASRIYTTDQSGNYVQTIQDIIDRGQVIGGGDSTELGGKGNWNSATIYKPKNIVTYNGSSFIALIDNTNEVPVDGSTWQLLASKGDQGAQGSQGIQGEQGIQGLKGDQGIQGVKGDQGIQGIQGEKGMNWQRAFSVSTAYVKDEVVFYNGSSYICLQNTTAGILPTDETYWDVVAQKGADGVGGGGGGVGTVTNVSSANGDITVTNPTSTPELTLNAGTGANQILKLDASGLASADILKDGTTNKVYSDAEKTKLAGLNAGTGANDVLLLDANGKASADIIVDGATNKAYSDADKTKLAGIASGAEVNQNAFSNVSVKDSTGAEKTGSPVQADLEASTVTLKEGSNITITADPTTDTITISATAPTGGGGGSANLVNMPFAWIG